MSRTRSARVRTGGKGTLRFKPADGPGGRRKVVALVEQDGLPRKRITVATFKAPPRVKPGAPKGVTVSTRQGACLRRSSDPARRSRGGPPSGPCATASASSCADGRRLFFLRDADRARRAHPERGDPAVSVRVVGLRADNGAGPAATANTNGRD